MTQANLNTDRRHDRLSKSAREELRRLRRENRQLKLERDILSKAVARFARDVETMAEKTYVHEREPGVADCPQCGTARCLSRGYQAWRQRPPFKRSRSDAVLLVKILVASGVRGEPTTVDYYHAPQ